MLTNPQSFTREFAALAAAIVAPRCALHSLSALVAPSVRCYSSKEINIMHLQAIDKHGRVRPFRRGTSPMARACGYPRRLRTQPHVLRTRHLRQGTQSSTIDRMALCAVMPSPT
jgi:hypothetical protein